MNMYTRRQGFRHGPKKRTWSLRIFFMHEMFKNFERGAGILARAIWLIILVLGSSLLLTKHCSDHSFSIQYGVVVSTFVCGR